MNISKICKDCYSCTIPCGRTKEMNYSWHQYFIHIAQTVAIRSKDPRTQVGAVIVDSNNHIISTGYNGCPAGFPETDTIWNEGLKYFYVVHAEMNALLHSTQYTGNCKLYTTLSPCGDCAKAICAAGIKEVYYLVEREDDITDTLFKGCGVLCEKIELD